MFSSIPKPVTAFSSVSELLNFLLINSTDFLLINATDKSVSVISKSFGDYSNVSKPTTTYSSIIKPT